MTKRRYNPPPKTDDIFGAWVPIVALAASRTECLRLSERDRMMGRIEEAYRDIATGEDPSVLSWRDLADAMNFLQSCAELDWTDDPEGVLEAAKAALCEAAETFTGSGRIRMTGTGLAGFRFCVDQFAAVVNQISAHSYWVAVAHTKRRISRIHRGGKKAGDVVVHL